MTTTAKPTTRRPSTLLLVFAVPVVALIAIVATRVIEGPSSSTAGAQKADAVLIKNFAFVPSTLTVAEGTTVKVTNGDDTTHTLTAKDGAFNTGDLGGGKTATLTLSKSGTFEYYCKIHNYMTGTLVVK